MAGRGREVSTEREEERISELPLERASPASSMAPMFSTFFPVMVERERVGG